MKLELFSKNKIGLLILILSMTISSKAQILNPDELALKKIYTTLEEKEKTVKMLQSILYG